MEGEPTESESASIAADPLAPSEIEYARPSTPHVHVASGITRGDFAALAVRLLGIYLIVGALPSLAYVIESLLTRLSLPDNMQQLFLLDAAIVIAVGTFMVIKAAMIGGWMLPKETMNPHLPPGAGTPQELQAVAFSVVGVMLAVFAFPDLGAALTQYAARSHFEVYELIKPGIEFIAGSLLFLRSKRLARYWQNLPATPTPHRDDDGGPL